MANPILNLGNNEWATKSESLLGYSKSGSNFKPVPFTHSRASIGTTIDRNGVLQTEAGNIPRIDFKDNIKGALLLEPQRTNSELYSEDFINAAWNKINTTIISDDTISPSGELNADKFARTSTSGSWMVQSISKGATATTYTTSAFIKKGSDNYFAARAQGSYPARLEIRFRFDTEEIYYAQAISGFVLLDYGVENYANDWYRIYYTYTTDTHTSLQIHFSPRATNGNIDSSDTSSSAYAYIWGAQTEQGSYPTSYIQTEGSAVTRTVDDFENTDGVSLSGDFTYFVHIKNFDDKTLGNFPLQFFFRQSASPFSYFRFLLEGNERFYAQLRDNNTATTVFNQFSDTLSNLGDNIKLAFAKSGTSCKYYVNGTLVLSSTITDFNYTLNRINHTTGNDQPAKLSQVMVFDTALTDAELIQLTT